MTVAAVMMGDGGLSLGESAQSRIGYYGFSAAERV
jgi:hypothetical protein